MIPLVDCLAHLVEDHLEKDHVVEVLNFLVRSVVAPMDLQVPLSEESVLSFLMAFHMGFHWLTALCRFLSLLRAFCCQTIDGFCSWIKVSFCR